MRLSISSFKSDWKKALAVAFLAFTMMFCILEIALRTKGVRPSIRDTHYLWSTLRHRAAQNDPRSVVFLGASRMQLGIDPIAFAKLGPDLDLINLSVNGQPGLGTLKALSEDRNFHGVALLSSTAASLSTAALQRQEKWNQHYESYWKKGNFLSSQWSNQHLRLFFEENFALFNSFLRPSEFLKSFILKKEFPEIPQIAMRSDRFRVANYDQHSKEWIEAKKERGRKRFEEAFEEAQLKGIPSPQEWLDELVPLLIKIKTELSSRGARFFVVRFPSSEAISEIENRFYPKELYWKRLKEHFPEELIHYKNLERLPALETTDG